jgi:hypothetical protein
VNGKDGRGGRAETSRFPVSGGEQRPPFPNETYVDFRMAEWRMGEQPRRIQRSVRRVLTELHPTSLLMLKDPRMEVMVLPAEECNAWAYFPIRRPVLHHTSDPRKHALVLKSYLRRTPWLKRFSEKQKLSLASEDYLYHAALWRRLVFTYDRRPKAKTRVLLVLSKAKPATFEDRLKDALGHAILYLRNPEAWNGCENAWKEWCANRK